MSQSRRAFLKQASATAAFGVLGPRVFSASEIDLRRSADEIFRNAGLEFDEAAMKALALRALDAAKSAGAQYADVRINYKWQLQLLVGDMATTTKPPIEMRTSTPGLTSWVTVGVRAVVDGSWGFAGGSILTLEE